MRLHHAVLKNAESVLVGYVFPCTSIFSESNSFKKLSLKKKGFDFYNRYMANRFVKVNTSMKKFNKKQILR